MASCNKDLLMRDDITTQGVLFTGLFEKPFSARFDQPDMSSDGGAVLLSARDKRLGLIEAIAGSLNAGSDKTQRNFEVICGTGH